MRPKNWKTLILMTIPRRQERMRLKASRKIAFIPKRVQCIMIQRLIFFRVPSSTLTWAQIPAMIEVAAERLATTTGPGSGSEAVLSNILETTMRDTAAISRHAANIWRKKSQVERSTWGGSQRCEVFEALFLVVHVQPLEGRRRHPLVQKSDVKIWKRRDQG